MVPGTFQASVCDEQLMSIGGEICAVRKHIHKDKINIENTECVDRHTSHVIFLMRFTCVNDVHTHRTAQGSRLKCLHARVTPYSCHP